MAPPRSASDLTLLPGTWVSSRSEASTEVVPNYARAFSSRPQVYAAWQALGAAVSGAMDHEVYEAATVGAARALRSTYCSLAHGRTVLEKYTDEAGLRRLLDAADSRDVAGAAGRLEAVAAFAAQVATAATEVDAEDIAALSRHGLDEQTILDVVLAAAARCFFSTVLDGTGTRADEQYRSEFSPELLAALSVGRPVAGIPWSSG